MSRITVPQNVSEFYGAYCKGLEDAIEYIAQQTEDYCRESVRTAGRNPVESFKYRIKSPDSMAEKLTKRGYEVNAQNACTEVYDAAGVRIVTSFISDIPMMAEFIRGIPNVTVTQEKDYVNHPKKNGYRSYHIICKVDGCGKDGSVYAEVQLRTVAMDTWASIEHSLKYKKYIGNEKLIVAELKRYADELASIDISLQTLREIITNEEEENDEIVICGGRTSNVGRCCGDTPA